MKFSTLLILVTTLLCGCSKAFLKYNDSDLLTVDDAIPTVQIKEMGEDPNVNTMERGAIEDKNQSLSMAPPSQPGSPSKLSKSKKSLDVNKSKKSKDKKNSLGARNNSKAETSNSANGMSSPPKEREPKMESNVGFEGGSRRPIKNPFRVGEKVVLSVRYFKADAGELQLEIKPFVEVNGHKSYRWFTGLKTTGMFSRFYTIDDWSETLVDFETLLPSVYELQVRESGQLKNGKGFFDQNTLKGVYAEKKYTEKRGHQEKNQAWQIAPFSQNVFSAAFYMRIFSYEVGKDYKFIVSDDEKNIIFRGKALRKERLETEAGVFNTIVIKPEFEVDGVFKPVGDIFFWLTDDDRKFIVRIESEIKIGTLIMEAVSLDRGKD